MSYEYLVCDDCEPSPGECDKCDHNPSRLHREAQLRLAHDRGECPVWCDLCRDENIKKMAAAAGTPKGLLT